MLQVIYDTSMLVVYTVSTWGLRQVESGVGVVRRWSAAPSPTTSRREQGKRTGASRSGSRSRTRRISPVEL